MNEPKALATPMSVAAIFFTNRSRNEPRAGTSLQGWNMISGCYGLSDENLRAFLPAALSDGLSTLSNRCVASFTRSQKPDANFH
eukprot:3513112-Amphidinium_carterae.1